MNLPSPDAIQVTLTLTTLAALWFGWIKLARPKVRAKWDWLIGILQSIGGRDPIIDRRTGIEISPKVPSLGVQLLSIDKRFETVNENMAQLIEVVKSNQAAHNRIDGVEARVDNTDARVDVVEGTVSAILANTLDHAADKNLAAEQLRRQDVVDGDPDD